MIITFLADHPIIQFLLFVGLGTVLGGAAVVGLALFVSRPAGPGKIARRVDPVTRESAP